MYQRVIFWTPLHTQPLPPHAHTNCFAFANHRCSLLSRVRDFSLWSLSGQLSGWWTHTCPCAILRLSPRLHHFWATGIGTLSEGAGILSLVPRQCPGDTPPPSLLPVAPNSRLRTSIPSTLTSTAWLCSHHGPHLGVLDACRVCAPAGYRIALVGPVATCWDRGRLPVQQII